MINPIDEMFDTMMGATKGNLAEMKKVLMSNLPENLWEAVQDYSTLCYLAGQMEVIGRIKEAKNGG